VWSTAGLVDAFPFLILVALVIVAQYVQTKQMSGRNANAQQNPQMQVMQRVMPLLFGFISYSIAAGINVYFLVSSLFRIGQQGFMYRFDPVLKAHVAQQTKEIETKAYDKPKEAKGKRNGAPKRGAKDRRGKKGR
jgi:YidC/Oxa1 family membrane protein insertase